jgi:riboflavin synthase
MFTGIIEEVGNVQRIEPLGQGLKLVISSPALSRELGINDSVAINGACHTVVQRGEGWFTVDSVEETLKKTTMGLLGKGDSVNLELPVRLNARLGGHLVLGHVDTVGEIVAVEERSTSRMFSVRFGKQFARYVIPVGSVAIDGVSLTVAEAGEEILRLSIIPHTMEKTIFPEYAPGRRVNIEFDVIGKYIERITASGGARRTSTPFPSEDALRTMGF